MHKKPHFPTKYAVILGTILAVLGGAIYFDTSVTVEEDTQMVASTQLEEELHSVAVKDSNLGFFDTSSKNIGDRLKDALTRTELLTDYPETASGTSFSVPLKSSNSSFNDYLRVVSVNLDKFAENFEVTTNFSAKNFAEDFADQHCIYNQNAQNTLSASGAVLLTGSGTRLVSLDYFVDLGKEATSRASTSELRFSNSATLQQEVLMREKISIDDLEPGDHLLTILPSCSVVYENRVHTVPGQIITVPFSKPGKEIDEIPLARFDDQLMKIISPAISSDDKGSAVISLPRIDSTGKRVNIYSPYIQTGDDLTVEALVDINVFFRDKYKFYTLDQVNKKSGRENEAFSILFELYRGGKLERSQETPLKQDSLFNEDYATPYHIAYGTAFNDLEKGEYELVSKLFVHTFENGKVKKKVLQRSKIENIGIGDVVVAIGDATVEGTSGIVYDTPFTYTSEIEIGDGVFVDPSGRNYPTSSKGCELKSEGLETFIEEPCNGNTNTYTSFTKQLGQLLTQDLRYPVMVVNESYPEDVSLEEYTTYLSRPDTILRERMNILKPNSVIVQTGALEMTAELLEILNSLPTLEDRKAKEKEFTTKLEKDYNSLLSVLKDMLQTVTPKTVEQKIFVSIPQSVRYDAYDGNIVAETIYNVIKKNRDVFTGPNFYKIFVQDIFNAANATQFEAVEDPEVFVNSLGFEKIALEWLTYFK